jgi:hypothetical protein
MLRNSDPQFFVVVVPVPSTGVFLALVEHEASKFRLCIPELANRQNFISILVNQRESIVDFLDSEVLIALFENLLFEVFATYDSNLLLVKVVEQFLILLPSLTRPYLYFLLKWNLIFSIVSLAL